MTDTLDDVARDLLKTLLSGPKVLHIGLCPVQAIQIGWDLIAKGYAVSVRDEGTEYIAITDKGRALIEELGLSTSSDSRV